MEKNKLSIVVINTPYHFFSYLILLRLIITQTCTLSGCDSPLITLYHLTIHNSAIVMRTLSFRLVRCQYLACIYIFIATTALDYECFK